MPQQTSSVIPEVSGNTWVQSTGPAPSPIEPACWLVLFDRLGLGQQLALQLRGAQKDVIEVIPGDRYRRISRGRYVIRPGIERDYSRLVRSVLKAGHAPTRIVHLWSLRTDRACTRIETQIELGLCSIPYLLRQLRDLHPAGSDIAVISNVLQSPDDSLACWLRDSIVRLQSALAEEFPQVNCRSIDVDTSKHALAQIAVQVIREHSSAFVDPVVAYRGDERWVQQSGISTEGNRSTIPQQRASRTTSDVEALLESWWRELLMVDHISADDDFFDLGGDSIIAVQLFRKINAKFEIDLGLSTIFDARTIRQLADLIVGAKAEAAPQHQTSPCVVAIQPKGKETPLHVISGLGGNVIKFQKLAFHLGEDQPIFGLLPRGLDGKEPYFTRIEDMAAFYANAIQANQPVGPYRLMGYSFGGLVAFETARQLTGRGTQVSFVGLLDTAEPQYLDRLQKTLPSRERYRVFKDHLAEIVSSERPWERFKNFIATKISSITFKLYRALGRSVPQDLGKIEYINLLAGTQYHPGPYEGKLTIFRSTIREISDGTDRALGWGGYSARTEVVELPSNHFNLLQEPNVRLLAEKLRSAMNADVAKAAVPMEQLAS